MQGFAGMSLSSAEEQPEKIWSHPASRLVGVPNRLLLTGTKKDGLFKPMGLELPSPAARKPDARPLPLNADLLPLFDLRPFGEEERVDVSIGAGAATLTCKAGRQPAGVVFNAEDFRFPRSMRGALVVEGNSSGGSFFAVVPKGQDAPSMMPDSTEGSLASLPSTGWPLDGSGQLVMVCPNEAASVIVTAVRLAPDGGGARSSTGTWLWEILPWLDNPVSLISSLQREGVRELFLQLPVESGEIANKLKVVRLLAALADAGIAVHAVEGDADMAGVQGRAHALERGRVLCLFREETGLISSIQYDIEPYLRAGFDADPASGWREWSVTIRALADILDYKVSVVVPFWMLDSEGGEQALESVKGSISNVVVMAYRTDSSHVEQIAEGWLHWGVTHELSISIALENGPLPVEFHRTYERSARGDLVFGRLDRPPTVRLLTAPVSDSYAEPTFSLSQELEIDPSRISFMDDRDALAQTRERLGQALPAWTSYERLIIHGLITPGG